MNRIICIVLFVVKFSRCTIIISHVYVNSEVNQVRTLMKYTIAKLPARCAIASTEIDMCVVFVLVGVIIFA